MEERRGRSLLQNQGFLQLVSLPPSLKPMGTPASVACEPLQAWQEPEPRTRKKASANIFQDMDLLQLQGLFQNSGDKSAKERAQIVWDCAGDSRLAEALIQLQRRRRRRSQRILQQHTVRAGSSSSSSIGVLSIHHFSQLCIEDGAEEHLAPASTPGQDRQSGDAQKTAVRNKRRNRHQDPSAYLHQIRQ